MRRRIFIRGAIGLSGAGSFAGCVSLCPPGIGGGGVPPAEIPVQPAVSPSEASVVVSSMDELAAEAGSGSGRVIWIEGGQYELRQQVVTRNIIASGRGQDAGIAVIHVPTKGTNTFAYKGTSHDGDGAIVLEDGGRLTGVHLIGAEQGAHDHPRYDGYHPKPSGSRSERFAYYGRHHARGVHVIGRGCSVDNCEISHFATQLITVGNASSAVSPIINSNYLHNSMMSSAGYGVDVKRGHPRIKGCHINATRHSIDGFGHHDCGYTVQNTTFGPDHSSHILDMHRLGINIDRVSSSPSSDIWRYRAGGRIVADGCEFQSSTVIEEEGGHTNPAVHVRGVPADGVTFTNNALPWGSLSSALKQSGIPREFSDQVGELGFTNLRASGNRLNYSP